MSWYVENLIRNSLSIKSKIYDYPEPNRISFQTVSLENLENMASYELNLEDFDYQNLLLVEKKLKELVDKGQISKVELEVLTKVSTGRPFNVLAKEFNMYRITFMKIFSSVCARISFHLGGVFTNSGYLNYLCEKYNLTEEQMAIAEQYITKEI